MIEVIAGITFLGSFILSIVGVIFYVIWEDENLKTALIAVGTTILIIGLLILSSFMADPSVDVFPNF